jgi:hypothetical protein
LKRMLAILAVAGLASGCASTGPTPFLAPDGSKALRVKCTVDPSKCLQQASQSCAAEGGYRVLDSQSNAGGLFADVIPGPVTWYSMAYTCGPSDGKMPSFPFVGQQYVPPQPVTAQPARQAPRSTNCYNVGNMVNCTTY